MSRKISTASNSFENKLAVPTDVHAVLQTALEKMYAIVTTNICIVVVLRGMGRGKGGVPRERNTGGQKHMTV